MVRRLAFLLAVWCGTVAANVVGYASQDGEPAVPDLVVKPNKGKYLPLEAMYLAIHVKNKTDSLISFCGKRLGFAFGTHLNVLKNGRFVGADASSEPSVSSNEYAQELGSGEMVSVGERVVLEVEGFSEADIPEDRFGQRKLRVSHKFAPGFVMTEDQTREVESGEIEIEIVEPSSAADQGAREILRQDSALAVYNGGAITQEQKAAGVEALEQIIVQYPTSGYASTVGLRLGRDYYWSSRKYIEREIPFPDGSVMKKTVLEHDQAMLKKALTKYQFVLEKATDDGVRLRARMGLAEVFCCGSDKTNGLTHLDVADQLDTDEIFKDKRADLRRRIEALDE